MQIYPGTHQLKTVSKVDLSSEIPLAYIDKEYQDYAISIKPRLEGGGIKPVLPYQKFDSQAIKLFKPLSKQTSDSKDYEEVDLFNLLQRIDDQYQYIPQSATTFNPQEFVYSLVVKKQLDYNTKTTYNLKVACDDESENMSFSKRLIRLFGDAPDRGICPANIWANNKDISPYSLINHSMEDADFVFIESKDGINYKDTETRIDFDTYLNHRANVWMTIEKPKLEIAKDQTAKMKDTALYTEVTVDNNLFLTSGYQVPEGYVVHNLFEGSYAAAIILECPKKGFIVQTTEDFLNHVEKNIKAFYEILFYIYKQTYLESEKTREWITDIALDYVVVNNALTVFDKCTSKKKIYEYFGLKPQEVSLIDVWINQENIKQTDVVNDYLVFKKDISGEFSKYADPIKPPNTIAVYTARRNVMFFDEFVYTIEDDVSDKITWEKNEREYLLSLGNFKHTYLNINFKDYPIHEISIPLTITENYQEVPIELTTFALYVEEGFLSIADINKQEINGTIIAEVKIYKTKQETMVYDMRRRGGGLPEGEPDDYNLLDIGHIFGLSYRKAGAVVITLPERLKQYETIIEEVVRKHLVSEKVPIILFKKEEDM